MRQLLLFLLPFVSSCGKAVTEGKYHVDRSLVASTCDVTVCSAEWPSDWIISEQTVTDEFGVVTYRVEDGQGTTHRVVARQNLCGIMTLTIDTTFSTVSLTGTTAVRAEGCDGHCDCSYGMTLSSAG